MSRDNAGKFAPGNQYGRQGKTKGAAAVAKLIMRETRNLAEVIEFHLIVMRDPLIPLKERQVAASELMKRAIGMPAQSIELQGKIDASGGGRLDGLDWSKVSAAQLDAMTGALSAALGEDEESEGEEPEQALVLGPGPKGTIDV